MNHVADPYGPLLLRSSSWPEVAEAARETRVALLPVGSIEQHGPHLPLDLDLLTAEHLALEAARLASRRLARRACVVAPSLPFGGPGRGMTEWPGTLTLLPETFVRVYCDLAQGLLRSGFPVIAAVNGCYGNVDALQEAIARLGALEPNGRFLVISSIWEDREIIARVRESGPGGTGHACEVETSIALVLCPDRVRMDLAVDEIPVGPVSFDFNDPVASAPALPFGELTRSGVIGRPTLATRAKGEAILRAAIERVALKVLALGESS
jgi:creatinine amidohydrolase